MGHLGGVFGASRLVPPKTNPGCTDFHQLCTDPSQRQTTREIQLHLRVILRIGRDHEGPRLDRQQVVCPHEPPHPFVVDQEAAPPEFRCEAPVALPAPVGDGDPLNGRPHGPLFFHGLVCLPRPVEPRSAHLG
jgi:hypothetical protein